MSSSVREFTKKIASPNLKEVKTHVLSSPSQVTEKPTSPQPPTKTTKTTGTAGRRRKTRRRKTRRRR